MAHSVLRAAWPASSHLFRTCASATIALAIGALGIAQAATDDATVDALFNWAEYRYPNELGSSSGSLVAGGFRYRFYAQTGVYLGYRSDDDKLYLLPQGASQPIPLGAIAPFLRDAQTPPSDATELAAYLQRSLYRNWPAESAAHPSAGPHFGNVRTWINPVLQASLIAGDAEHPVQAAAVKEMYGAGSSTPQGWSVMVRNRKGNGGEGWYWYEIYNNRSFAASQGASLCTGCHSAGKDFVRISVPLK